MKKKIFPVVLSGGKGLRLWPMSQPAFPKQFLSIQKSRSLLHETFKRIEDELFYPATIIGNHEHRFLLKREIISNKIKFRSILLEPFSKNTFASIILSVIHILKDNPDCFILILPADHIITNKKDFINSVKKALVLAESGFITTFGINPTKPDTSFGYIKTNKKKKNGFIIEKFIEKPNLNLAKKLIRNGNCFWNSGMFLFNSKVFIEECYQLNKRSLELAEENLRNRFIDLDFEIFPKKIFNRFECIPFDKAIMEKTSKGAVIPFNQKWSDIGSWTSLWNIMNKNDEGNISKKNVITSEVKNSLILSNKKVIAIGLEDMIIVEDDTGLLVSKKSRDNDFKILVEKLLKKKNSNSTINQTIFRPWGEYKTIYCDKGFLIKILRIYPKNKISLQYHKRRSEHWVVVEGVATVTQDEKTFKLQTNESTFISRGQIHRLANDSKKPLTLVEVQTGDYLKEDDIIRLEDIYGRSTKKTK